MCFIGFPNAKIAKRFDTSKTIRQKNRHIDFSAKPRSSTMMYHMMWDDASAACLSRATIHPNPVL